MIYHYQALDRNGNTVSDYIDAVSETVARQKIRSQGLYPVKLAIHEVSGENARVSGIRNLLERLFESIGARMLSKHVGIFSRQLATLLKAGMPLPVAINDIVEQIENKQFRNIIADVKEKIEEGSTFSNALARHRSVFSEMYINMVKVGENLGSLDQVIDRLAEIEEKKNILKSKIRAALWYPAFMFSFAILVVIFLMVNVIPAISEMFEDQQRELPLPTEIVIAISGFLSSFWFMIPLVIIAGYLIYKRYSATTEGRNKIDEIKLKMPLFSNLYKKLIVLRITQNLGILLNNKVDLIKSFEIIEKLVGNRVVEQKLNKAQKMVKEGSSVSLSLNKGQFLPRLVIGMIAAGEASDNLDSMLINIGNVYETEIDLTVSNLTSLIEPVIIIIMGVAIGIIVLSVMLPIMDMNVLIQ